MVTTLILTYADGVFKPDTPVDLPENFQIKVTVTAPNGAVIEKPAPGSPEAWAAYIEHLSQSTYHFGNRFDRDALYDRI